MGETHEQRETSGVEPEAEPVEAPEGNQATPEDFEDDPARNPEDETLKDIKGG